MMNFFVECLTNQPSQPAFTCSNLTIETLEQGMIYVQPERRQWCHSGVFIVNFEHISHFIPVFLLLILNMNYRQG